MLSRFNLRIMNRVINPAQVPIPPMSDHFCSQEWSKIHTGRCLQTGPRLRPPWHLAVQVQIDPVGVPVIQAAEFRLRESRRELQAEWGDDGLPPQSVGQQVRQIPAAEPAGLGLIQAIFAPEQLQQFGRGN
jgi:hypothetical protein